MSSLGAISNYMLSVQQMQMSLIKTNVEMQQQVTDLLTEATEQMAANMASSEHMLDMLV